MIQEDVDAGVEKSTRALGDASERQKTNRLNTLMATGNRSQQVSAAHLEMTGISAVKVETSQTRKQPGIGATIPKPLWISTPMQQRAKQNKRGRE